jgi:hypothetical protein
MVLTSGILPIGDWDCSRESLYFVLEMETLPPFPRVFISDPCHFTLLQRQAVAVTFVQVINFREIQDVT